MQPWQKQKSTEFMEYKRSVLLLRPQMSFPTFCLQIPGVHLTVLKGFIKPAKDIWGKQVTFRETVGKDMYKSKQVNNIWLILLPHFFHSLYNVSSYEQQL